MNNRYLVGLEAAATHLASAREHLKTATSNATAEGHADRVSGLLEMVERITYYAGMAEAWLSTDKPAPGAARQHAGGQE